MYRALLIDPGYTVTDRPAAHVGYVRETPIDALAGGLGVLLDRLAAVLLGGVLVLTDAALAVLDMANAGEWKAGTSAAFTRYTRKAEGAELEMYVAAWSQMSKRVPLWSEGLAQVDFIGRLRAWHDLTGHPYAGTPGVAGTRILRATLEGRKKAPDPTWFVKSWSDEFVKCEREYTAQVWDRPWSATYEHAYDITDAYPAGAGGALVARDDLKYVRTSNYLPDMAGLYKVDVGLWPADSQLPDPAGYSTRFGERVQGPRWVTAPTVGLLHELREAGHHPGYTILDARLAKGYQELKGFRLALRDARVKFRGLDLVDADVRQRQMLDETLKAACREALGMLDRPGGRMYRPDWWYTAVAATRANLWRKLHTVWLEDGRVPHRIKTDCVWYESDQADPYTAAPEALKKPRGTDKVPWLTKPGEPKIPGKFKCLPGKTVSRETLQAAE